MRGRELGEYRYKAKFKGFGGRVYEAWNPRFRLIPPWGNSPDPHIVRSVRV